MDRDRDRRNDTVFSKKVNAGKRRTYFFDIRQTKGDDYFLTITESTKRFDGEGFERHKVFVYKEDFNRFIANLEEVVNYVKTELMPDYDYEEFDRRHEEWDARNEEEGTDRPPRPPRSDDRPPRNDRRQNDDRPANEQPPTERREEHFDDDLSW